MGTPPAQGLRRFDLSGVRIPRGESKTDQRDKKDPLTAPDERVWRMSWSFRPEVQVQVQDLVRGKTDFNFDSGFWKRLFLSRLKHEDEGGENFYHRNNQKGTPRKLQ